MLRIEIETDNAAFGDDGASAAMECARLLDEIADQLRGLCYEGSVMDASGNRVGRFTLTED